MVAKATIGWYVIQTHYGLKRLHWDHRIRERVLGLGLRHDTCNPGYDTCYPGGLLKTPSLLLQIRLIQSLKNSVKNKIDGYGSHGLNQLYKRPLPPT